MPQKRTRSTPLQITEESLVRYPRAKDALAKVTRDCELDDRRELVRLICAIPLASPKKEPLVAGRTDRSLRDLPKRIRNWADEIERVNRSSFLNPKHLTKIARAGSDSAFLRKPLNLILHTPESAARTAINFERLPKILRLYADCLREWLPLFKLLGRHGFRPQVMGILSLMKFVRDRCKRPRYEQIATLLEAAFEAAGNPRSFGADDLRKLKKNNVMLWLLIHPEVFSSSSIP